MARRELPAAIEIEKKLLSAMMLKNGEVIPKVANLIAADDFYREENRIIFRAMLAVYNRETPPDVLLIEEELIRTAELERVNRRYLFSLIDLEFSTARAEAYANTIKTKSILRRLINAGLEIADEAGDERKDVEDVLEDAERKVLAVTSQNNQTGFEKLSAVLQRTFERIQHIHNNPGTVVGVTTGIHDIDKVTNGRI